MAGITIIFGSDSDWKNQKVVDGIVNATQKNPDLGVIVKFASAHNTPARVEMVLPEAKAIASGAGMSAALPGIIEACYTYPNEVSIGVPLSDAYWGGLSAFLSISEMPPNHPVICTGVDNIESCLNIAYAIETKKLGNALVAQYGQKNEGSIELLKSKFAELKIGDRLECIGAIDGKTADEACEKAKGSFLISVYNEDFTLSCAEARAIDNALADSGGFQIALLCPSKKESFAGFANKYMSSFNGLRATGTLPLGSAGVGNAAMLAARIFEDEPSIQEYAKKMNAKRESLENSPQYIVMNGKVMKS